MSVTSPDFESGAYTNFATPAGVCVEAILEQRAPSGQLRINQNLSIFAKTRRVK